MKIAMLSHFSPPIHGAALVGDLVKEVLAEHYELNARRLSRTIELGGLGRIGLVGYFHLFMHVFWLLNQLAIKRVTILYYTPALDGAGWYRDVLLLLWAKLLRLLSFNRSRIILHIHMRPKPGRTETLIWQFVVKNTDLIVLSPSLCDDFVKLPMSTKVNLLPNSVVSPISDDVNKVSSMNILYLGHISSNKGTDYLLRVLIKAMKTNAAFKAFVINRQVSLTLAGTLLLPAKELKDQIEQLCVLGLHCELFGPVYGRDKANLFSATNVFVHPSLSEALPLTLLECFSYGIPVVARNVGGMKDIVEPEAGLLFTTEDEMVSSILAVLTGNYDSSKIKGIYESRYTPLVFKNNFLKIIGE